MPNYTTNICCKCTQIIHINKYTLYTLYTSINLFLCSENLSLLYLTSDVGYHEVVESNLELELKTKRKGIMGGKLVGGLTLPLGRTSLHPLTLLAVTYPLELAVGFYSFSIGGRFSEDFKSILTPLANPNGGIVI